jgi:hypothetical protein
MARNTHITMSNIEELIEARNTAQAEYASALVDDDGPATAKARKAVEVAQLAVDEFQIKQRERAEREAKAKQERKVADTAARWATVGKLKSERVNLSEQLRTQAANIGELVQRLHDNRTAIIAAAPVELEGVGTLTDINALSAYMRQVLELAHAIPWSSSMTRWEVEQQPNLTARLQVANDQIARAEARQQITTSI